MKNISGELMSCNTKIADVVDGMIVNPVTQLLPLYLLNNNDIEGWLKLRAIDSHRPNSRLLKKVLRLENNDDISAVLNINAATITDTYWLKESGTNLSYEDVKFNKNYFDKLALYGDINSFNNPYSRTPELTNTGSFEKCWRLEDERWWLYKKATELELFSELFICEFGKSLGLPMAEYKRAEEYIKSLDFTNAGQYNYEPAFSIVGDNEDYHYNYCKLSELMTELGEQYVLMLYLDTLCFNMDRHTQNYGVLRDVKTGRILSMAPFFDHNIALISRGYLKSTERKNDLLINLFNDFCDKSSLEKDYFDKFKIPNVDEIFIEKCLNKVDISVNRKQVIDIILNAKKQIRV